MTTDVGTRFSISYITCPSDPNANEPSCKTISNSINTIKSNYFGSVGDSLYNHSMGSVNSRGFFQGGRSASTVNSSFPGTVFITMAALVDGTSNTVAIGEGVTVPNALSNKIKGGIYSNNNFSSPSACNGYRSATDSSVFTTTTDLTANGRGYNYAYGTDECSYFNTILPPNSPSCRKPDSPACFTLSSFHSGGANVVLADGSVRFVSETINCGTISDTTNVTVGESKYGVWGAMGSVNGGETKSL